MLARVVKIAPVTIDVESGPFLLDLLFLGCGGVEQHLHVDRGKYPVGAQVEVILAATGGVVEARQNPPLPASAG